VIKMPDIAIEVRGLSKQFGDVTALDGLDLKVQAGTVFGLLGPNGAGKSTLVRILATLVQPTAGRAAVLGHDVVGEPLAVRRRIGLAGQFAAVDGELTGRENSRSDSSGSSRSCSRPRRSCRPRRCRRSSLEVFELVETTADHVRRAHQVQRLLAAKHQRGRKVPDLLLTPTGLKTATATKTVTITASKAKPKHPRA
jgi:ABC-type multidrug transport system ATPase subunit